MRILHVVHTPRFSGAEMLVLALTKLHTSTGHPSAVVAMFPPEADFNTKITEQKRLGIEWFAPAEKLSRVARLAHLRKANSAFKPDVVFAHSVLPAAYARVAGLPNVISVLHDASENDYGRGNISLAERGLQYLSSGVITVSSRAAENYSKLYSAPRVKCIPNGIELATYEDARLPDRVSFLTSLGLPGDAVIALQVGRITGIKQQFLSVRAIASLIKADPKIHLLLAGIYEDAESLAALHAEIQTQNIASNVHLLGPRDDVAVLLKLANVYLMPSKQEAHSVALIEALASGISVVAANIATFQFARELGGVDLIDPEATSDFCHAISLHVSSSKAYKRNLDDLNIKKTAASYIQFSTTREFPNEPVLIK